MTFHPIPPRLTTPRRRFLGYRNLTTDDYGDDEDCGKSKQSTRSPLPRIRLSYQAMQRTTSKLCDLLSPKCSPIARRNRTSHQIRLLESTESVLDENNSSDTDGDELSLSSSLDSLTSVKLDGKDPQSVQIDEKLHKYWRDSRKIQHDVSTINNLDSSNHSLHAAESSKLDKKTVEGEKTTNVAPSSPLLRFIIKKTLKVARSTPSTPKFNLKFFNRFPRGALTNPQKSKGETGSKDNCMPLTSRGSHEDNNGLRTLLNSGAEQPNGGILLQPLPTAEISPGCTNEDSSFRKSPLENESLSRHQQIPLNRPSPAISDGVSKSEPRSRASSPLVSARVDSQESTVPRPPSVKEYIARDSLKLQTIVLQKKHATERFGMKLDRIIAPHLCSGYVATQATYIAMILPQSPAHSAGLQAGDRILKINLVPVENHPLPEILDMIRATPQTLLITYEPRPFKLFLLTMNVRKKDGRFGLRLDINHQDLRVDTVIPDSPAAQAGLRRGQKVMALNGKAVTGLDQNRVMHWLRAYPEDQSFSITVLEDAASQTCLQAITDFPTVETENNVQGESYLDGKTCYDEIAWWLEKRFNRDAQSIMQRSDQDKDDQQCKNLQSTFSNSETTKINALESRNKSASQKINQEIPFHSERIFEEAMTGRISADLQDRVTSFG